MMIIRLVIQLAIIAAKYRFRTPSDTILKVKRRRKKYLKKEKGLIEN
jgi:hypothetical protein